MHTRRAFLTQSGLALVTLGFAPSFVARPALAAGQVQLGTGFWQFREPEIAKLLARAGFHWAFIDTEHGGFDLGAPRLEPAMP